MSKMAIDKVHFYSKLVNWTTNKILCLVICLLTFDSSLLATEINHSKFPDEFLFGVGTSAYQIEGGWNEGGKGENIWDNLVHNHPEKVEDHSTGDIACDSYHKFKEDVALVKNLGLDFYRFSLSWSRIFPTGHSNQVSADGVRYYNELIDELLVNDIKPMVTLFHWDLPQPIQDFGGMANPEIIELFSQFVQFAFESFGDRVKVWFTFNDPDHFCVSGYGEGTEAPLINSSGIGEYLCGHNILKAHARAYHLYHANYRITQGGRIGINLGALWFEPSTNQTTDIEAANRAMEFELGKWANPIFSKDGDYPKVVKDFVANRSREEGYAKSRLPMFTDKDIKDILGTSDYFGYNYYSARLTADIAAEPLGEQSTNKDMRYSNWVDPTWEPYESSNLKIVPWAFRKALNWIKEKYSSPEILITENGFIDSEVFNDQGRIRYHKLHLESLLEAIHEDNVRVTMYSVWTLMDNFEWSFGYTKRFGLYHVNFSDPNLPRTARASANYYKEIVAQRKVVPTNFTTAEKENSN